MSRMELGSSDIQRASWFGVKPLVAKLLGARAINPFVRIAAGGLLPDSIGQRLPLNRRSVTYRLTDGSSFELLDPLHDIVARDIYWGRGKACGAAERHKLDCIERLAKQADLFIDIGAYAGLCSLIAARSNSDLLAIAYEIVPENFLLLVRNIVENDVVGRVEGRLRGLGERPGSIKLPVGFGAASYMTSISLGSDFKAGVSIPVVPLDDEIGEQGERILIKIDVEGFEDQVLAGAANLIAKKRPDMICEVLPGTHDVARAIQGRLSPLGYRWFCFEDGGAEPRDSIEPGEEMRDWLFTTRPEVAVSLPT